MSPMARSRRCARCRSRSRDNEIVTIIGANGAGKTTLLNAIMGILPLKGRVAFAGEDISAARDRGSRRRRAVSLVPEHRELFATMSVEDNLQLGAFRSRRRSRRRSFERVYALFPRLKERRTPARRHAVRRRAADAGDGPRADGRAEAADAGRAEPRAGAASSSPTSSRIIGDLRAGRRLGAAGRAERAGRAAGSPTAPMSWSSANSSSTARRQRSPPIRASRRAISACRRTAPTRRARGTIGAAAFPQPHLPPRRAQASENRCPLFRIML